MLKVSSSAEVRFRPTGDILRDGLPGADRIVMGCNDAVADSSRLQ